LEALLLKIIANKEFGTLVIICCFTVAQFYQNKGQFALHLEKIETIKEKSDKAEIKSDGADVKSTHALHISKKAIETSNKTFKLSKKTHAKVDKMSDKVDGLSQNWQEFIEGKYGDKKDSKNS